MYVYFIKFEFLIFCTPEERFDDKPDGPHAKILAPKLIYKQSEINFKLFAYKLLPLIKRFKNRSGINLISKCTIKQF